MVYKRKFIEIKAYFNWFCFKKIPTHTISYLEFGDSSNENILICAHGLTRNAHDFNKVAKALSNSFRIIAIDYAGRGASSYFTDRSHYNYHVYLSDTVKLFKALNIKACFWLGTSMGGLIGMALSASLPKLLKGLIINDIGPEINKNILNRINKYSRTMPIFDDIASAKKHFKYIYNKFGIINEIDWDHLTNTSLIKTASDQYKMHYDPNIIPEADITKDVNIWSIWQRITCAILLIHGAKSDILTKDIVNKMLKKSSVSLKTIDGAGHAPGLTTTDEVDGIKQWLLNIVNNN